MSDQLKPTGEWTGASLCNAIEGSSYGYVANQINAAIAAEREKYQRSQEKVREYFDLLAAEREKRYKDNERCRNKLAKAQEWEEQLREQLAALENRGGGGK